MRFYITAALLVSGTAIAAGLYFKIQADAKARARAEQIETTLEKAKEFKDAISNPGGCSWFDRLHEACAAD